MPIVTQLTPMSDHDYSRLPTRGEVEAVKAEVRAARIAHGFPLSGPIPVPGLAAMAAVPPELRTFGRRVIHMPLRANALPVDDRSLLAVHLDELIEAGYTTDQIRVQCDLIDAATQEAK